MRAVWATYLREMRAYFVSPLAYVVLFFFLFVNGFVFSYLAAALSDPRAPAGPPMTFFFSWTPLFLLILSVVLTMRLLAEELRSGSIEVLMTAPVTEGQVIAGKYLAAFTFFSILWMPTLAYAAIIDHYSEVDWGPVAAGYLGILLVGALFLSIGTFVSAMTSSQLVAAMVTGALLLVLLFLSLLADIFAGETAKQVFSYLSLSQHIDELSRGIVDSRRLVFYASSTLFFLFLASRALEDKKWR